MIVLPMIGYYLIAGLQASLATPATPARESLPEFDVASIKPTDVSKDVKVGVRIYPGGRVEIRGTSLAGLIHQAFLPFEITGGGDWVYQVLFDLVALPPKPVQDTITDLHSKPWIGDERLRQMLQALIVRRFDLRFEYQEREGDVYFLRTGTHPIAARPTTTSAAYAISSNREPIFGSLRQWTLRGATMADLADWLSGALKCPVLDKTGLDGAYDYEEQETVIDPEHRPDSVESHMRLLRKLNLQVIKAKGPVRRFVITGAHKPSEN
jgi:uncharacterized protein (TIGR03435 family)